jgi:peptidoglycan-N-acetylglucosamine deacetylase
VVEVGHALGQHVTNDDAVVAPTVPAAALGKKLGLCPRNSPNSPPDGGPGAPARTEKPIIILSVIRHLIAPHIPQAASALHIQRALPGATGVAITFDDGPHPEGTPAVLQILAEADIKATFFLVGEQVERRPALAAEIARQGHLVALHGYRHRPQPLMTKKEVQMDLERGAAAIQRAMQAQPVWHRPPYGVYSAAGLAAARARGLRPLLWSRWGKDWRRFTTPARIASRATANVRPGDVILLHDADFYSSKGSHERTALALGLIVRELKCQKIGTVLPV